MGMQINTNLAANNAYRNLSNTQNDLSKSLEKLSSGLRINRAGDDAAGLALSEGLKSQIGGLTVASRNAQDGIGAVQTAEGGLNQTQSILQRLRDLGVQAGNDTNNADSRNAIKTEADSLVSELDRIGKSTNFNGAQLLDGSRAGAAALKFQVGANSDAASQITVDLTKADVGKIASTLGAGTTATTVFATAGTDLSAFDAGQAVTFSIADTNSTTAVTTDNLKKPAAGFKTVDELASALNADSKFSSKMVASVVKTSTGVSELSVTALSGGTVTQSAAVLGATDATIVKDGLDFSSASGAQASIKVLDQQITAVSTARAELGASQNRLESAVQTINVAKENLTASNSRIRDTDMAEEMVKFTRNNILSQAGTAMLAQANQSNQGVLQLLR
ncbi:flagellin N-terminal helical domain-containing protein [Arthrobacter sp. PsM3]|uniref:flagellin N-terminal helical domain-containing protein n=1 Tax=Arthrobacter sp. PsM3 TaxID=3030531 RepID=UPI00263B512C|nr:flagellin [Arthrobacter sp. PsM3]MDN4642537.1 flagellin [Arthrobacter sp. PsM3]